MACVSCRAAGYLAALVIREVSDASTGTQNSLTNGGRKVPLVSSTAGCKAGRGKADPLLEGIFDFFTANIRKRREAAGILTRIAFT